MTSSAAVSARGDDEATWIPLPGPCLSVWGTLANSGVLRGVVGGLAHADGVLALTAFAVILAECWVQAFESARLPPGTTS